MNFNLSNFGKLFLPLLMICYSAMPLQAGWFWYQSTPVIVHPAPVVVHHRPVVVYQEPSMFDGVCALGACVGLGIAAIVGHRSEKKRFNMYIDLFRDRGFNYSQAKHYAKIAMDTPGGFDEVIARIEQKQLLEQLAVEQEYRKQKDAEERTKHHTDTKIKELKSEQELRQAQQKNNWLFFALISLITILIGIVFIRKDYFKRSR